MYVFDDYSDIERYSTFKKEVEKPYWLCSSDEDFDLTIGGTTPQYFPIFTESNQEILRKIETNYDSPPMSTFHNNNDFESFYGIGNQFFNYYNPYFEYYKYLLACYVKSLNEQSHQQHHLHHRAHCEECVMRQYTSSMSSSGYSNFYHKNINSCYQKSSTFNPWLPWWILKENI